MLDTQRIAQRVVGFLMAQALQSEALAGSRFAVEGHADPRGDARYKQELSQKRAQAVVA